MGRFNLLLLEEGEYLLEEFAAELTAYKPDGAGSHNPDIKYGTGRLRISTKNLSFEPDEARLPILRFPLKQMQGSPCTLHSWPLLKEGTPLAAELRNPNSFLFQSPSAVEMKAGNVIGAFKSRAFDEVAVAGAGGAAGGAAAAGAGAEDSSASSFGALLGFKGLGGGGGSSSSSSSSAKQKAEPGAHTLSRWCFLVTLQHVGLAQCLPLLSQLCSIQAQCTGYSSQERVLLEPILQGRKEGPFNLSLLSDYREAPLLPVSPSAISCERVFPLVSCPGRLMLTEKALYFQPVSINSMAGADPVVKWPLKDIKRIVRRLRFLRQTGLELLLTDSSSFAPGAASDLMAVGLKPDSSAAASVFLSFSTPKERDAVYGKLLLALTERVQAGGAGSSSSSSLQQQQLSGDAGRAAALLHEHDLGDPPPEQLEAVQAAWLEKRISNFDYLMFLNSLAGRTLADLTQYPVMPWVIKDYSSEALDLSSPSTFRDLSKPIGALNASRLENCKRRYADMAQVNDAEPPFLYGTHYSTPGYCLYYNVRSMPEHQLLLQAGKFDAPDRLFFDVSQCWAGVSSINMDVKELIPEFYEGDGSFLCIPEGLDLGIRQNGRRVGDVVLPPWAYDACDFVTQCRDALECDYVSEQLHHWIDLIFGHKQTGPASVAADNVFYHLTYHGAVNMEALTDPNQRVAIQQQIAEFGQTPLQIFFRPHPQRGQPLLYQAMPAAGRAGEGQRGVAAGEASSAPAAGGAGSGGSSSSSASSAAAGGAGKGSVAPAAAGAATGSSSSFSSAETASLLAAVESTFRRSSVVRRPSLAPLDAGGHDLMLELEGLEGGLGGGGGHGHGGMSLSRRASRAYGADGISVARRASTSIRLLSSIKLPSAFLDFKQLQWEPLTFLEERQGGSDAAAVGAGGGAAAGVEGKSDDSFSSAPFVSYHTGSIAGIAATSAQQQGAGSEWQLSFCTAGRDGASMQMLLRLGRKGRRDRSGSSATAAGAAVVHSGIAEEGEEEGEEGESAAAAGHASSLPETSLLVQSRKSLAPAQQPTSAADFSPAALLHSAIYGTSVSLPVTCTALSADGRLSFLGSLDERVYVVDRQARDRQGEGTEGGAAGAVVASFRAHAGALSALTVVELPSPAAITAGAAEGKSKQYLLLTGGWDGKLCCWSITVSTPHSDNGSAVEVEQTPLFSTKPFPSVVTAISCSSPFLSQQKSVLVAVGCSNGEVSLCSLHLLSAAAPAAVVSAAAATGAEAGLYFSQPSSSSSVSSAQPSLCFSLHCTCTDMRQIDPAAAGDITTGGASGVTSIVWPAGAAAAAPTASAPAPSSSHSLPPIGSFIAASADGKLSLLQCELRKRSGKKEVADGSSSLATAADPALLEACSSAGIPLFSGSLDLQRIIQTGEVLRCCAVDPAGKVAVTGGLGGSIRLWDLSCTVEKEREESESEEGGFHVEVDPTEASHMLSVTDGRKIPVHSSAEALLSSLPLPMQYSITLNEAASKEEEQAAGAGPLGSPGAAGSNRASMSISASTSVDIPGSPGPLTSSRSTGSAGGQREEGSLTSPPRSQAALKRIASVKLPSWALRSDALAHAPALGWFTGLQLLPLPAAGSGAGAGAGGAGGGTGSGSVGLPAAPEGFLLVVSTHGGQLLCWKGEPPEEEQ